VSFDLIQVEQSFPRVKPTQPEEDKAFHEVLSTSMSLFQVFFFRQKFYLDTYQTQSRVDSNR